MGTTLLRGARVYRHGGDTDMPPIADVLVRDGRIAAIAPRIDAADEIVELAGHLLVPGFVNGHYHSHDVLAKGMFETMALERWGLVAGAIGQGRSVEEVRLRTLVGAVECARNGITTVQDFANVSPMRPEYIDAIVDAYTSVGIRVVLGITVRDRSQLETILWADEMVAPAHREFVGTARGSEPEAQIRFVADQMDRIGDRDGGVIWAISPSAPQRCSPELLAGVARLSSERNIPVYSHVYETRLQRPYARTKLADYGGSAIRYMQAAGLTGPRVTIAHAVWPDEDEIAILSETGTGVVLNMLSNLRLRSGVAPLAAYRRNGIALSLGCDNCSCSDVQSMLQVMKLYCLVGGISDPDVDGPTAAEAIRIATIGGAAAACQSANLGALEPGMAADIVAYDLSDPAWRPFNSAARQIVYAETGRGLRHVWVGGRQIVRNGSCTSVDETILAKELDAAMPAVRRDLDLLCQQADEVMPSFHSIYRRAFATELGYDRYLSRK